MALVEDNKYAISEQDSPAAISIKNVLFATDFSAPSEAAFPYATAISRRFGATLHSAHVLSDASILLMTGGVDYVSMGTIYEDAHTEAADKLAELTANLDGIAHRNCAFVRDKSGRRSRALSKKTGIGSHRRRHSRPYWTRQTASSVRWRKISWPTHRARF